MTRLVSETLRGRRAQECFLPSASCRLSSHLSLPLSLCLPSSSEKNGGCWLVSSSPSFFLFRMRAVDARNSRKPRCRKCSCATTGAKLSSTLVSFRLPRRASASLDGFIVRTGVKARRLKSGGGISPLVSISLSFSVSALCRGDRRIWFNSGGSRVKFGEMDKVGELDRSLNFEGMVGCLSTRIERRKPRLSAGGSCPKYRHEGGWLTETSISRNLPKTWGAGGACKGRKGAKDNREVGRQCSRQFPHVAFSKTYFSSSSASDLRSSSSGLRMASFREQPRLLTVFHARIFLPSFCLPPSFFLFWNYRPLTPTLSSSAPSGDKINLEEKVHTLMNR